ncbi:putative protein-P-II uridylyltransferase [Aeromicrobium marinum DSM 15272]|uniref:Bifunctional uridylyltransferase/uridylyl-removing enzyme n=1 Tax=Aeromicrobium marinum DSM 15272 TaxID=585531 RepID=E2SD35_9ACTN|nr:[protein-PII] uridylyltransferase [Aeromicrobium marinum]EFQ83138.1 putative protein-P-II uridylyltransferase [Aeromicrobium marinum DSM 15272]
MDRRLRDLFAAAVPATGDPRAGNGVALVAVGGYGRSELSPHSDVDVALVHDPAVPEAEVARIAAEIWYPLWDDRVALDHSVRDTGGMRQAARDDHRVALGMLDARTVAGDAGMVMALRSEVLADYRRDARERVEQIRDDREHRIARSGWVPHAAIPDLKNSAGGLRDAVIMRGLVATWLVDVPHGELESLRRDLLDVRDVLQEVTGRHSDLLDPAFVPEIAGLMGLAPADLDLRVRSTGRRIAHLCALTWRRLDDVVKPRSTRIGASGPVVAPMAPGVGLLDEEVIVTADADPGRDPEVALRAAVVAARTGRPLGSGSAVRLAATLGDLPEPWPASARRAVVDLLTSGPGLVPVWDELDIAGVVDRWLPEWSGIRLRGSSSPVHRHTVDRHSIGTCVAAAARMRGVERPDLLAVGALLHDIGKGREGDHSAVGRPMAVEIARRWGFDEADAAVIGRLVRWHLLLPTVATRRDIEDPTTVANLADVVEDAEFLTLLAALTAADATATSDTAWSRWRRGLVEGLVVKTADHLAGRPAVDPDDYGGWPAEVPYPDTSTWVERGFALTAAPHQGGSLITVVTRDEPGLMARIAGALAVAGLDLLSVRSATHDGAAASLWEVTRAEVDVVRLRERVRTVLDGELDLVTRFDRPAPDGEDPRVRLLVRARATATMIDVRATDRRGLIWQVCRTIAGLGHSIRSAHISTYGSEARDVFYVVDETGHELGPGPAEDLRAAIEVALA